MNISDWNCYLKLDDQGQFRCMSQQTYEPLINKEGNIFCANYDWENKYQRREGKRTLYTKDVVDFFFDKEVNNVLANKDKPYAPEIIDIDYNNKRLYYKWYGETCNDIVYSNRKLTDYCSNWKEQVLNILLDLYNNGTYKLTMYSHCHIIDSTGQLRTIDWYGCVSVADPVIEAEYMEAIVHGTAIHRIQEVKTDRGYDLSKMFKRSLGNFVKWGYEDLDFVYKAMFKESSNA
jgi:hypothetical protein